MTQWLGEAKATLFCPGIPGAGKTIVAATTIDHLLQLSKKTSLGVAYIFCNYKMQEQQDVLGILAAILKQLVQGRLSTAVYIERLYEEHDKGKTKPSLDNIYRALQDVLGHYPTVHIVIDALDECQDSTRVQLLAKLRDLQTGQDVRLMATSRFMLKVESVFKGALMLEVKASEEDVKHYVVGQTWRLPTCIQLDAALQKLVQEKIVEAVDGM
jgi:Cdc6-like AAA superfamily ATPase